MSGLQIALSLIGVLLILAIIGHGMWTIRNNDKAVSKQQQELARKRQQRDAEGFDADGIGSVRVVQDVPSTARGRTQSKPASAPTEQPITPPVDDYELPEAVVAEPVIPKSVTPPPARSPSTSPAASPQPPAATEPKPKPDNASSAPEQIGLGIDEVTEVESVTTAPDEVIVLHVKGDIQGAVLLQQMTELGFKYGDFDIFHRHETTAGTGPVLFSLANMFNPGTFDIDAMETFKTEGLALFLALPVKGSAQQAFTMMHNAAQKIATAVGGGQVLDEHRNPLTRQTVQHIVQRIREYERRQLLRQHGG